MLIPRAIEPCHEDPIGRCGRGLAVASWLQVLFALQIDLLNAVMPLDVLGRTRVTLTEPASSSLAERPG